MSERIHSQLNVIKEKEANVNKNKDMSMDKNMSKGKMSEIKLDMISATLNENVRWKKEVATKDEDKTEVKIEKSSELRNAFKLMLESRKGAVTPSKLPKKRYVRRKIGEIKPSPSRRNDRNGSIDEWLRRHEK